MKVISTCKRQAVLVEPRLANHVGQLKHPYESIRVRLARQTIQIAQLGQPEHGPELTWPFTAVAHGEGMHFPLTPAAGEACLRARP